MYVVIGATGNTGSVVAKELLAREQKVRAISRTADRLQPTMSGVLNLLKGMAGTTRLELATSAVTGQRSNQLNYVPNRGINNLP